MDGILEVVEKIRDTEEEILNLENFIKTHGESPALTLTLLSLRKRQQDLQATYAQVTANLWVDVLSFRLFNDYDFQPSLLTITNTLGNFQRLFTIVYDALKKGPKNRYRVSADATALTSFGFHYSFTGSIGFMLTLPNERTLMEEIDTDLDRAMRMVFELASSNNSDQISRFAKTLGPAPIRMLYQWSSDLTKAALGAEINWQREEVVRAGLTVQAQQVARLQQVIEATSEEEVVEFTITGQLVGADIRTHTFHIELPNGETLRGRMSENIGEDITVNLPHYYTADIEKKTVISYSTEEERVDYFLKRLRSPDQQVDVE